MPKLWNKFIGSKASRKPHEGLFGKYAGGIERDNVDISNA